MMNMKTAYHIFTVLLFLLLGVSCQKEEVRLPSNESPTEGEGISLVFSFAGTGESARTSASDEERCMTCFMRCSRVRNVA